MRRTEMIDLLKRRFSGLAYPKDNELTPENILEFLEELGMMPPALNKDKCQALMHVYYDGYFFNQWDEEFEKDEKAFRQYTKTLERKEKELKNYNKATEIKGK